MTEPEIRVKARVQGFFYGWVIVIASYFIVFTFMASYYTFGVFFKSIQNEFGWDRAQTSLGVTINLMTGGVVAILVGRLVDKYKPRNILLFCSVLAGLSYFVMSKISSLGQFYLIYGFVLGIAMSANYVIPAVLINRWFIKKRGLGLGIVFSAFGMAQIISPPVAAYLLEGLGWRNIYIYMGALLFIIVSVASLLMRSSPEEMGLLPDGDIEEENRKINKSNSSTGLSISETLRTPAFWLISLLWLFGAFPVYILIVHLIPYSTDVGISILAAASIMTAAGISNIVGRIALGHFSDRFGSKTILLLSFAMVIIGLLLLIRARTLPAFYLSAILVALFINGGDTVVIKVLGDLFGTKSLGFIVGFTSLAWRGGAASGAYLAGVFFDATRSYAIIFSLAAVAISICFLLTIFIFTKKPKLAMATSQ